jgi:GNAT superfamily N-acetyltransferase
MIQEYLLSQRPDLVEQIHMLNGSAWPEFIYQNESGKYWSRLFDTFADYQIAFCDGERVVALGHTIPIQWTSKIDDLPAGWDAVIELGALSYPMGPFANTLSALAAVIAPEYKGQGLSTQIIRAMRTVAASHGFESLIAPVRPTQKALYPLTLMEKYVHWQRADGLPFDAWIRTHFKLGATILKVAQQSMVINGTVAEWEAWTGLTFPESGEYVVAGALAPVTIDCEQNVGVYYDVNVWMQHFV